MNCGIDVFNLNNCKKYLQIGLLGGVLVSASGCATHTGNSADPFEPFNRGVYQFNDALDRAALKPASILYREVMPEPAKKGVNNFFGNLSDFLTIINGVLQAKFSQAASDGSRFLFNSTFGLFGLLDVASDLEKHDEDFGQTLGYWGVPSGPYVVLPFFGPSTVRDSVGLYVDSTVSLAGNIDDVPTRNALMATKVVNVRANLLDKEAVLDQAALDRYAFIRDSFLQYRLNQVYDGNPPFEFEDELFEDADARTYLPAIRIADVGAKAESDVLVLRVDEDNRVDIENFSSHQNFHHMWVGEESNIQ